MQTIEIRHSQYRETVIPFDFSKITQADQYQDDFQSVWAAEIGRDDVRFCVLDLGTRFSGFNNKASTRPEFFESIRRKNFGTILNKPQNYFSLGENPQSECGPYFVYLVEIRIARIAAQVEVVPSTRIVPSRDRGSNDDRSARRWQREPEARRDERAAEPRRKDVSPPPRKSATTSSSTQSQQVAEDSLFPPAPDPDSIGLAVTTLTGPQAQKLGLYQGVQGALILGVAPDSPAARAGLEPGMVIESIDARFVGNAADYSSRVSGKKHGDQFNVGVWVRGAKWTRSSKRVSL